MIAAAYVCPLFFCILNYLYFQVVLRTKFLTHGPEPFDEIDKEDGEKLQIFKNTCLATGGDCSMEKVREFLIEKQVGTYFIFYFKILVFLGGLVRGRVIRSGERVSNLAHNPLLDFLCSHKTHSLCRSHLFYGMDGQCKSKFEILFAVITLCYLILHNAIIVLLWAPFYSGIMVLEIVCEMVHHGSPERSGVKKSGLHKYEHGVVIPN